MEKIDGLLIFMSFMNLASCIISMFLLGLLDIFFGPALSVITYPQALLLFTLAYIVGYKEVYKYICEKGPNNVNFQFLVAGASFLTIFFPTLSALFTCLVFHYFVSHKWILSLILLIYYYETEYDVPIFGADLIIKHPNLRLHA